MSWLSEASKLGVSALWVGNILWHIAGIKRSTTFIVSNLHLTRWGVDRKAKSRALKKLAEAGLIIIDGRDGNHNPKVTIIGGDHKSQNGILIFTEKIKMGPSHSRIERRGR